MGCQKGYRRAVNGGDAVLLGSVLGILIAGCRPAAYLERLASSPETTYAVDSMNLLEKRDVKAVLARLATEFQTADAATAIERMSTSVVPAEPELTHRLVGYRWTRINRMRAVTIDLECRFPTTYVLAEAVVIGSPPNLRLWSFHVQRVSASLEEQNAFRLGGRSVPSYSVLAAAVAIPALILVVLVICIRTPMRKRKWLWVLYIIVGFGKLTVNWTSGAVWVEEFAIQLLGSGFRREGLYGPWIVSVSLPVGAVQFLLRRKRLRRSTNIVSDVEPALPTVAANRGIGEDS